MDKRLYILNEMKRVAQEIAPEPLRKKNFVQLSNVLYSQIRRNFESWNAALAEVGLEAAPPAKPQTLSEDKLMEAIGDLWRSFGRRPTEDAMTRQGRYSVKPYRTRWGSFSKALDYYVNHCGQPASSDSRSAPGSIQRREPAIRTTPTRQPPQPHEQKSQFVGDPLNFRGLLYAPVNEQGVVYLFGMVSRELGFLVETIHTQFPDCKALRRESKNTERWEKVKIEFEYKSSNFLSHGHDAEQCDLIVCWIHDWHDSPPSISVLELRDVIRHLPD